MKTWLRRALQSGLGLERYLDLFARYKLATFGWTDEGSDFRLFLGLLPHEGVVLDVGANVGFTTVLLARRLRHGLVHAFEPGPANHAALERTVRRHHLTNVRTHRLALGAEDGPLEMVTPVVDSARMVGLTHVVREASGGVSGERFTAECRALDHLSDLLSPGQRVVGVKVDVEDYESRVLEGGRGLLASHRPPILCELWETENRRRCFEMARELGYAVRVREGRRLVAYEGSRHRRLNFYLLPDARAPE